VPFERNINPHGGWICSDEAVQLTYDLCGAAIAHDPMTPHGHPFASMIWAGSCGVGQLTPGGLVDASQHGKVGASVRPRVNRPLDVSNRIYGSSTMTIWDFFAL
jgi:hypothetical protein